MPTREQMRSLAEEIVHSYEDRVAGIAQLRQTVKMDLKEFQDGRTAMGKQLKADLAKGMADRKADVGTELEELNRARATLSKEMKADLAKGVADRKADVGTELEELNRARGAVGKQLKADLAKGMADRKADVGTELEELNRARATLSKEMKADLAKGVADHKRDVGDMLKGFDADLKDVRTAQAEGRDEWQKMTTIMQAKRGASVVEVKPPEAVAPPPVEEVAPPPPVEEIAEEEAVARAEVAEVTPEITALRDQVFEYLANHPDGTRLVELEEEFGLARIQMARVVRNLTDENKVEKRGLLYFAI